MCVCACTPRMPFFFPPAKLPRLGASKTSDPACRGLVPAPRRGRTWTTGTKMASLGDRRTSARARSLAHVRWVTRSWGGWKQKPLWLAQWGHFNSCLRCLRFSRILHRLPRPLVPYSSGRPLCSFIYWQQGGERIAICRSNCLIHLVGKQCCFEWPVNVLQNKPPPLPPSLPLI